MQMCVNCRHALYMDVEYYSKMYIDSDSNYIIVQRVQMM
jgi:hypothetical protein